MTEPKKSGDFAAPTEAGMAQEARPRNQSSFVADLGNDEDVPPPSYGDTYGAVNDEEGSGTRADVTDDGRVNIRINQQTRGLSSLLVPALRSQLDLLGTKQAQTPHIPPSLSSAAGDGQVPPLNVVIHVVGSRGDVQPFVALGKVLKEKYHHRVRLATHPVFRDFVTENGLEFFNITGDPAELMAFMVKNPGLMPGFDTMRRGDIGRRRREIGGMVRGCWRSCIETGDGTGIEASDKNVEDVTRAEGAAGDFSGDRPFIADAIIANPPSFAHIHCAEKLGIPLHLMFTMPWSPTQSFPHPLANIQSTNTDANMTNFISYGLVDMMTWQGLGDVINRFRQKSLGLEPISATWAPGMLARLKIPWTYCWSPALIPKPRDWAPHITISGFYFLNLASSYTPEPDLAAFLEAGPPPVYIGFGSIVVDDPNAMTKMIFEAVKKTGQRALVSKGWGGIGADQIGIPEEVFMLGNVPHDWLFKHVSAVVHHGGAGTMAAGISAGRPTVIVPFFGDQPFWGAMVARAGAGPKPIRYKDLTAESLAESIQQALLPTTVEKAKELANSIRSEKGTESGADSFHKELDIDHMRCTLCPTRASVWRIKKTEVRLSAFAATVLGNEKLISFTDLKLYRPREHFTEDEPFDPISGGATALAGTMGSMAMGIADLPVAALKAMNIHPDSKKQKLKPDGSASPSKPVRSTSQDRDTDASSQPETAHELANQMASAAETLAAQSPSTQAQQSDPGVAKGSTAQASDGKSAAGDGEPKDVKATIEDIIGTGKGALRFASAGIKSPMDFTLSLARGFHNAPKLYGDESVRKSEKITDFASGVRVAGKEFGFGFYDGISGLITQPLEGAKKEGAAGFIKGFGKGLGGIVLKPGAAIWGVPGYTSQGIYKELQKRFGPSVDNYIIASRTAQGYEDVQKSTQDERAAVAKRWKEVSPYIRKKKTLPEETKQHLDRSKTGDDTRSTVPVTSTAGEKGPNMQRTTSTATADTDVIEGSGALFPTESSSKTSTISSATKSGGQDLPAYTREDAERSLPASGSDDWEFEEAVRHSVQETSKGDHTEDALIERAIRASVAELHTARSHGADDEEVEAAMERSVKEATKGLRKRREDNGPGLGTASEDDHPDRVEGEGDEELQEALAASEVEHQQKESEDEKAKREEEIVMQYMLKQSLAEDEMRRNKQNG